ncbi:MAG: hypothetical protein H6740_23375 [Alphaproteobacteria bacterium]|nr:hypothetical protein [Alphaproteobacteria bacterium]
MDLLTLTVRALREPLALAEEAAEDLSAAAPGLLAITAGGAALLGAVLGSYRGGLQLAFAALKAPALFLIPVLVTLPAMRALFAGVGLELPWRRVAAAGLVGMARSATLAAAAGPLLWLFYSMQPDYHLSVMTMAGALALVGLPGLRVMAGALPSGGRGRRLALVASLGLLGLVTMQTGWLLRPFIARPTAEVSLLRVVEGDVFSAMSATSRSARGDYDEDWDAELPPMYTIFYH